jgi:predicted CoA-binding protein
MKPRTPEQVLHDSLQEWNVEEFVELHWNTKAAKRAIGDLKKAGYTIAPLKPTQEMLDEVCSSDGIEPFTDKTMTEIYQLMIGSGTAQSKG